MTATRESATSYEAADGSELAMLVFEPAEGVQPVAGIVIFHGGALRSDSADGLAPHCRQLASRGIFAVSAGYRLLGQGAMAIDDCIAYVRRAVEHFSTMAAARGLESSRLASGGSSAGGHLALVGAMIAPDGPHPAGKGVAASRMSRQSWRSTPWSICWPTRPEQLQFLEQDVGITAGGAIEYSPLEFVRPGNPPMLIQHGAHDEVAPIEQARRFRDAMVRAGNDCILLEYERAGHAFHYPGPSGHFDDVVDATTEFLRDRLAAD